MKSLFLTAPCLLMALTAGLFTTDTQNAVETIDSRYIFQSISSPVNHIHPNRTVGTYCVFVIDINNRNAQADVENTSNWRYLGDISENIPSCGPGQLQACQLIVDIRDTELLKDGERILKSDLSISALLNKEADVWYVSDYISIGSYLYEVLNEENEID